MDTAIKSERALRRQAGVKLMKRMWMLYLFLLVPVGFTILFNYVPMYGVQIAFKTFRAAEGIWGSKWNNFYHFYILFQGKTFPKALWNTIYISFMRLIVGFPMPIIFAILLNEIRGMMFKRVVQTVSYLPHFMSWVVLSGIIKQVLSPTRGVLNALLGLIGIEPIFFLTEVKMFVPILLISSIWAGVGWGAIIYLASMSAIDPELYESASIDGAGRFRKAVNITVPLLMPVITIQLILSLGGILSAGFDQIFNLMNPRVMDAAEIIDTYVYRIGLTDMKYDLAAAVGLFKNVVGVMLVIFANMFARRFSEFGIW